MNNESEIKRNGNNMKKSSDKYLHLKRFIKIVWNDLQTFLVPVIRSLVYYVLVFAVVSLAACYAITVFVLSASPESQLDMLPITNNQLGSLMISVPVALIITMGVSKYVRASWKKSK